ncbi:cytochrome C (plasmid) [Sulfitobacter alexandrii]|uniref:Cytochrome C n=1 Tax=Sulfitobacter alexandrii TaxID=1917485 RepID=A0A1J0WN57_9RHOB|nr:c-type cytochrome [Sulfitobacter alexandrii]APE45614.1 cytochrome C [Sulfitobacter alexandrii]
MRQALRIVVVLTLLGLVGAGAVVGFGLYNVSARVGHWPGVSWVLHTTFRNSARLRAPDMENAPALDDPDLIALGAAHYATACAGCHAAPGDSRSATVRAMVPQPPAITEAVADWEPNELHWIIENGIKMSGMPAWPAEGRGDEVWSVVAYLVSIQQDRAPDLPSSDLAGVDYCRSCHGDIGGPVPRLDILSPSYVEAQLEAYLNARRPSGIMAQAASLVPQDQYATLARRLTEREMPGPTVVPEQGAGAELARQGTRDIPACLACHGVGDNRKGPRLFGQEPMYLAAQLRLWRDGTYTHDRLMRAAAADLTDADIDLLSDYFAAVGN